MAAFPTTIPADVTEITEYIRWWLGNVSTSIISDEDFGYLIQPNIDTYVDELCKIVYYSTVDTLNWLIRKNSSNEGGSGSSGEVKRRKEVRGKTTIEVEYSEEGSTDSAWEDILSNLQSEPKTIGCNVDLSDGSNILLGEVIIGGADVDGYTAGFRSRNSFGKAIQQNKYGYQNRGRRLF